jgi:hypothetical protein
VFVDQCKNIIRSTAGLNEGTIHGGQPFEGQFLEGAYKAKVGNSPMPSFQADDFVPGEQGNTRCF